MFVLVIVKCKRSQLSFFFRVFHFYVPPSLNKDFFPLYTRIDGMGVTILHSVDVVRQ